MESSENRSLLQPYYYNCTLPEHIITSWTGKELKGKHVCSNCLHFAILLAVPHSSWNSQPLTALIFETRMQASPLSYYLTSFLMRRSNLLLVRRPWAGKRWFKVVSWTFDWAGVWLFPSECSKITVKEAKSSVDFLLTPRPLTSPSSVWIWPTWLAGDRVTGRTGKPSWAKLG